MAGNSRTGRGGKHPLRAVPTAVVVGFLCTTVAAAQVPPGGSTRTLTLDSAIQLAEEQNPGLLAADEQINAARGAVWGAMGGMLPTISFSTLWNFSEKVQVIDFSAMGGPSKVELDFTQDYQGGVNIGMPLWTWGATRAGYKDARTGVDMAHSNLEGNRHEVKMQVTQTFYGVLLAEEGLKVAKDALAQAERQEAIAAQRLAHGAASQFDHLRAQVQVANLRPAVVRAEAMVRQAGIGLNLLLGLPADEQIRLEGELRYTPVELTLEDLKRDALSNRADLRSARLGLQRADLAVSMARASRLPAFMLSGIYSFRADNAILNERFNDNYMANLVVAVPIFDAFAAKSRTSMARAGREQARIMVDQLQQVIEAEVEQSCQDLWAAEQSYLAQIDNVAVAERALEIAQVSFENEMMTSVELMDSQLALTMARQNHFQSLFDYLVALARIEKAVGQTISY